MKQQFSLVDTTYKPALNRENLLLEYSDGACAQRSSKAAKVVTERLLGVDIKESGPILFVGHGASCLGIVGCFGRRGYIILAIPVYQNLLGTREEDHQTGKVSTLMMFHTYQINKLH